MVSLTLTYFCRTSLLIAIVVIYMVCNIPRLVLNLAEHLNQVRKLHGSFLEKRDISQEYNVDQWDSNVSQICLICIQYHGKNKTVIERSAVSIQNQSGFTFQSRLLF